MIEYTENRSSSIEIKNVIFHNTESIQIGEFYINKVNYCVNERGHPRGGCFYKVTRGHLRSENRIEKNFEDIFPAVKFCVENGNDKNNSR